MSSERSKGGRTPRLLEYRLDENWRVLAGRSDADNDILSLKKARANDLWFHIRGVPGSHVILQGPADEEPSAAIIKQAAAIAAWHSKARNAGIVPVACTLAKFVSKPKGAKAGTVSIRKERIIKVRPALPLAEPVPAPGSKNQDIE
ncbi:MAG: NFACT RNA binding domain-containing protein [Deltaproteobacteria bacterium]